MPIVSMTYVPSNESADYALLDMADGIAISVGPGLSDAPTTYTQAPMQDVFDRVTNLKPVHEVSVWSTEHVLPGVELANMRFRVFSTPISQVGQGSTKALSIADTNMWQSSRLPHAFDVKRLGIEILDCTEADLSYIRENLVLSWEWCQTRIDIGTTGLFDWDLADRTGVLVFAEPVAIPANTMFSVSLRFGNREYKLEQNARIRVTLNGVAPRFVAVR